MKKSTVVLLLFITCSITAFSQSIFTSVTYNKRDQSALLLELPYITDISEGFIVTHLKRAGYDPETRNGLFGKNSKINGFYTFKGVVLNGLKQPVDLYFKVEKRGTRQTEQSFIYMLVSKGNESFISTSSDKETINAARQFLNDFVEKSAAYKLDLDIEEQQYVIKDEQEKMDKLKMEEKTLNKKLELLQAELKKNHEDQDNQQKAIEVEQKKLADLKAQKSA
jgi:hypothetical protein